MKAGFVGLGRMGGNMVRRLLSKGHEIVAFAPHEESRKEVEKYGALGVGSLPELTSQTQPSPSSLGNGPLRGGYRRDDQDVDGAPEEGRHPD